jgi:hypothetical protein
LNCHTHAFNVRPKCNTGHAHGEKNFQPMLARERKPRKQKARREAGL